MDSFLSFVMRAVGFDDLPPTSNPTRKGIDQKLSLQNIPVDNDQTQEFHLDPAGSVTVVDGLRTISVDASTAFDLTAIDAITYRLTWTGAGAAPVFRTDRAINLTGRTLDLVVNSNLSLTITADGGTPFSAVVAGDVLFIPGISTGDDAGPFNDLNTGFWTVLTSSSTVMTVARDASIYPVFSGISEADIASIAADEFMVFTSAGVQVGDTVDLSDGFALATLRSFDITAVTPGWVQFQSTAPLGEESDIVPGTAGITVYTNRKRFVLIMTDQEVAVQYNGVTGTENRIEPLLAGTLGFEGWETKFGTVWKLVLVNRSSARAKITVASAE